MSEAMLTTADIVRFRLRECWVLASNRRLSAEFRDWTREPTIHALVLELVEVHEEHRRQGHFTRFLAELCADERFDIVVVEAVQNPVLAEALLRWGWDVDPGVMDFYKERKRHDFERIPEARHAHRSISRNR